MEPFPHLNCEKGSEFGIGMDCPEIMLIQKSNLIWDQDLPQSQKTTNSSFNASKNKLQTKISEISLTLINARKNSLFKIDIKKPLVNKK